MGLGLGGYEGLQEGGGSEVPLAADEGSSSEGLLVARGDEFEGEADEFCGEGERGFTG